MTGIKPGIFSVTLNTRFDLEGGYIGIIEWLYNLDRQQSFVTFAMRDMLTNAGTYDEAVEYLSEIPLIAPCYYILAGSQSNQVQQPFSFTPILFTFSGLLGCHHYSITKECD